MVSGLQNVQGVAVDAAGNVYYDEYLQGILYELPAGTTTPQVLATGLDYPNFMSAAPNGTVFFVTGQTAGNKIVRFNPKTGTLTTILTAPSPYDTAHGFGGLFITPSGDLYYTTTGDGTVNRLPAGSSTPQILFTVPVAGFQWPSGVAADASGDVFFTIYGNGVQVLPTGSGTAMVLMSQPGFTDGFAHEMALDSAGNVYFTDSYAGNIWKIPVSRAASSPEFGNGTTVMPIALIVAILLTGTAKTNVRKRKTAQ